MFVYFINMIKKNRTLDLINDYENNYLNINQLEKKYKITSQRIYQLLKKETSKKICACCKKAKPRSRFYNDKKSKDGKSSHCKQCQKKNRRKRNKPKLIKDLNIELKSENKKYCGGCKTIKSLDDFYNGKVCKECQKKRVKNWISRNRNKHYEYTQTWLNDNKEKMNDYQKKYQKENQEKCKDEYLTRLLNHRSNINFKINKDNKEKYRYLLNMQKTKLFTERKIKKVLELKT